MAPSGPLIPMTSIFRPHHPVISAYWQRTGRRPSDSDDLLAKDSLLAGRQDGSPPTSTCSFERVVSQASHVSPSLGPLQTLVMLSCGRWPSWILCRMRRQRDSWSIVASQVAAAREHTPHSPGSRRLGSAHPRGRGAGGGEASTDRFSSQECASNTSCPHFHSHPQV